MNTTKLVVVLGIALSGVVCRGEMKVQNLRCEYLANPLGIDAVRPRLSWIELSKDRGARQTAYEVLVASSAGLLKEGKADLWDSGRVVSDENSQVEYAGSPLAPRQHCYWKVRVWDQAAKPGPWSAAAEWEMGLLQPADWAAKWIVSKAPATASSHPLVIRRAIYAAADKGGEADVTAVLTKKIEGNCLDLVVNNDTLGIDPATNKVKRLRVDYEFDGRAYTKEIDERQTLTLPEHTNSLRYLRKSFVVAPQIRRAVLYTTALGLYEFHLNGQRVGDHALAPDWTDYRKRVRYQAYDVTKLLRPGQNAMGALLANGWYSGHIGNGGNRFFGTVPALFAQLEVTYADNRTERFVTDSTWKSHPGPILSSDLMYGEDYDARSEVKNWDRPGLDESGWAPAQERQEIQRAFESQVMEPVRQIGEIEPKSVTQPKPGCWVFDLGQNMVGVVRLKVSAPAGTRVTIRHAEMLNPDGTLYTQNLRGAPSIDHYICKGRGTEVWQPRFTFHGFRYVEISGLAERPGKGAVTGVVIASDTPRAGDFACSDPRLNQLQSNIQWGQRGNYLSVPTDCPQRDERLGWMGDAQVFIRTATYNADVAAFFTKWLVDVDDGQSPEGAFSDVNPNTMDGRGVPGWADAGVICPWTIYQIYGDKRVLDRHLPAMIKWIEFVRTHSHGLIRDCDRGGDYGDWLAIGADTSKDLIGTAYFAYSTRLVSKACAALGRTEQAAQYEQLFQEIKAAFNQRYVAADGRIQGNTQCAYAMALKFDLLPESLRAKALQYLDEDVAAKHGHLSTGFVGVSYLLPVLSDGGKPDTAYQLLQQDTFPSWLFSVKHGATTIWERWDGWTPEHGFQDPGMNSFNHYSLGSCGEFLFGGIGGIRPNSPGYKTIRIEPVIRPGLSWARASYDSIQGRIATAWKVKGKELDLKVQVPANTTATVRVPAKDIESITESGKKLAKAQGVKILRQDHDQVYLEVGSGSYRFAAPR